MTPDNWYLVENAEEVQSPALLIYPKRVETNIERMVKLAGGSQRLRPHAKTHKLGPIARQQIAAGITKFKAATIAEAEMLALAGAEDVLLAYQPVGPNARRFLQLTQTFPETSFSCLLDDLGAAQRLSKLVQADGDRSSGNSQKPLNFMLDLDCGQHRTGVPPDDHAFELYRQFSRLPGLSPIGLHAYDGHLHGSDPAQRKEACDAAFKPVQSFRQRLNSLDDPGAKTVVAGGTPTFPIHAARPDIECSPGTCVLWDFGYSSKFADLDFLHAALVLTRVISKPAANRLCLDLGHKAIASENPPPRVHFLNAPMSRAISHSEEHLVIEMDSETSLQVGDALYGVPFHVCPTVALHSEAIVIENGRATSQWRIEARARRMQI